MRPSGLTMNGDRVIAVTLLDELRGVSRHLTAPYILDATELGELLELGKIEHVIGAESQKETGETNALEGAANPRDQMGFTPLFAMDYLSGEEPIILTSASPRGSKPSSRCSSSTSATNSPDARTVR